MLTTINRIVIGSVIFVLTFSAISFTQEKPGGNDQNEKDVEHHHTMGKMQEDQEMKLQSIIREGEIDLESIDENGDGKVFQDQMCWNVVSDEAGKCPQCGMKLKEVSLEEAKTNLEKNEFKVK